MQDIEAGMWASGARSCLALLRSSAKCCCILTQGVGTSRKGFRDRPQRPSAERNRLSAGLFPRAEALG